MGLRVIASSHRAQDLQTFVSRLGGRAVVVAASRGLNEHVRLQEKQAVQVLSAQTRVPQGRVQRVTRVRLAPPGAGSAAVIVQDKPLKAGEATGRSWSRGSSGARIGDWKPQLLPRTFMIPRYGNDIFVRRPGAKKYPIVRVWGPVLPSELLRKDQPNLRRMKALRDRDLEARVLRHIAKALGQ